MKNMLASLDGLRHAPSVSLAQSIVLDTLDKPLAVA